MGGLIPLTDASRRPVRMPLITGLIILINVSVFLLELTRGEPFVLQWSGVAAQIMSGHHWITILTAMFMHGSWSTSSATWFSSGRSGRRSKTLWGEAAISPST
jgi:membrane associated rhomboid family serine protease